MNQTNPFLKSLAEALYKEYGKSIHELCLVFPNRRSGLFFKNYLSEIANETLWSPQIYTINEFVLQLSDLQLSDPVDLVFEVFEIYKKHAENPGDLDEFWNWGEMMLADFDDIDKYLVDASSIYTNIRDLKEIDSHFELTEDQKETIRKFWGIFANKELSDHQESFLKIWNILNAVYVGLNVKLRSKGLAYEGMIYRDIAEKIKSENYPDIPWNNVIICGFNALNKAENEIFKFLKKSGKGKFFWDYDVSYVNDPVNEAGRFMSKNLQEFPPDKEIGSFDTISSRKVSIYELPSDITQTKYLNTILTKENSSDLLNFNHTAVILGDEDLLIPVLTSMPENVEDINITMGYPMSSTPVYSFVDKLLKLQKNISSNRGKRSEKFYFKDVLSILNHQYLKLTSEEVVLVKIKEINNKNLLYLDLDFFKENEIMSLIFRKLEKTSEITEYLREILLKIASILAKEEQDIHLKLEKEYIYHLLTRLNKLKGIFQANQAEVSIEIFTRVFRKILKNLRIPFEGEPLAGVQIMGILESRLLDFKHVIFLSMNDGVMPKSSPAFSYIPHNLRYAYGMPTREDQDAIYAYYFYRLLQRSDHVSLLYNSKSDGMNSGEKSRYIYQLLYDSRFKTDFTSIGFNITSRDPLPIAIKKTDEIFKVLSKYSEKGEKYLSPSALNMYISCSLKFYFSYVAGLKELDTISEEIEADTFGNLLHEAMHGNYSKFEGRMIQESDFEELQKPDSLKLILDNAFRKDFYKTLRSDQEVTPEGKNIIIYEVLKRYIMQILEIDKEYAAFNVVSLETEYDTIFKIETKADTFKLRLGGKIDRIDKKNGVTRIIDYKTGQAETSFPSIESLFDKSLESRNKAAFQTLLYSWLYCRNNNETDSTPGLFITRKLFTPGFSPILQMDKEDFTFNKHLAEFEAHLSYTLAELMNPSIPFSQTDNTDTCKYCPYADICHRKTESKF